MNSLVFVCGSLLLLISVQYACGLQCYLCSGSSCDDTFDSSASGITEVSCPGSCLKTIVDSGGISRGCLPSGLSDGCNSGAGAEICSCSDKDLCNGSTRLHASFAFLALVISALALFNRL